MAEEPSTIASKPAPPHKLRYHGTTAPLHHGTTAWSAARPVVLGPALRAAPQSVKEHLAPGRRRSHHRGKPGHRSHLVVLGPGL